MTSTPPTELRGPVREGQEIVVPSPDAVTVQRSFGIGCPGA
jgi:hypothetical protein